MRPIGRELVGGIAQCGRSLITTIALFITCESWKLLNLFTNLQILTAI